MRTISSCPLTGANLPSSVIDMWTDIVVKVSMSFIVVVGSNETFLIKANLGHVAGTPKGRVA